jgi:hypothetical protein
MFGAQCLGNEMWSHCFLKRQLLRENYPDLLTQFVALLEENKPECWFQQDSFVQDLYGDRIVGHRLCPLRSLDLTSPALILCVFPKERI